MLEILSALESILFLFEIFGDMKLIQKLRLLLQCSKNVVSFRCWSGQILVTTPAYIGSHQIASLISLQVRCLDEGVDLSLADR